MKRLLILVMGVLILAGCSNTAANHEEEPVKEVVVETKVVQVDPAQFRDMTGQLIIPGQVQANEVRAVSAVVAGKITAMHLNLGEQVEEGTLLVEMDDEYTKLQKEALVLSNRLSNVTLENAKRTYERTKALYESGSATQIDFEAAQDALSSAKIQYSSGRNGLSQIEYQLRNMRIESPIVGVISERYVDTGTTVNAGTPLYNIVDISNVIIEAGVTESDINRLVEGQTVLVQIPAINKSVEGILEGIGPIPGSDQTYPIRVRIGNEEREIKPGMFAELEINTETAKSVLSIPKVAILHEKGEDFVYVVEGEKAVKHSVEKGNAFDNYFEIVSGLNDKDSIVVSGQAYLDDGDLVDIVE